MELTCDWCGKSFERYPSQVKQMNFCSRKCLSCYRSKKHNPNGRPITRHPHLSEYNRAHNHERMTVGTREKLREARLNTGERKSYTKLFGRHEHRVVAESILGRPLHSGEVVHHINGDKRDNRPENLMIFANQSEHARWHKEHAKGGDAR